MDVNWTYLVIVTKYMQVSNYFIVYLIKLYMSIIFISQFTSIKLEKKFKIK